MELSISRINSLAKGFRNVFTHTTVPKNMTKTGGLIDEVWQDTVRNGFVSEHVALNGYMPNVRQFGKYGTLRGEHYSPKYIEMFKNKINLIDAQFKRLSGLRRNTTFYRGMTVDKSLAESHPKKFGLNILKEAPIGSKVMPDYGYGYASESEFVAEKFGNANPSYYENLIMEINAPKGSKISYIRAHGGEGLFPRMAEYTLKSRTVDDKGIHVVMDYIQPKQSCMDKIKNLFIKS